MEISGVAFFMFTFPAHIQADMGHCNYFERYFFKAFMLGSMMGASFTACMAARTSFNPEPVKSTSAGSSLVIRPSVRACFKPA